MALFEDIPMGPFTHIHVDCRRDNGAVSEKALDMPEVHPLLQEKGSDGMSEHVRGDPSQFELCGPSSEDISDRLFAQTVAGAVDKQKLRTGGSARMDMFLEGFGEFPTDDGNDSFAVTLPGNQYTLGDQVNRGGPKIRDL